MRYYVCLWLTPTSLEVDIKQVVRASDVDDGISSLMKALDVGHVHMACAYPVKKAHFGPSASDWRWNVRCSISGRMFTSPDRSIADLTIHSA